jgi:hypothetical protein
MAKQKAKLNIDIENHIDNIIPYLEAKINYFKHKGTPEENNQLLTEFQLHEKKQYVDYVFREPF